MESYIKVSLLFIFFLSSCNQEKKNSSKDESEMINERRTELESINQKSSLFVSQKYNALIGWDTSDYFTYELQEIFNTKSISFMGIINDIIKKDSFFILHVSKFPENYRGNFVAEISVNYNKFQELKFRFKSKRQMKIGCFIFKVSNIQSVFPEIISTEENSYLTFSFRKTLVKFKGDLIDFYIFKDIDDED